MIDLEKITGIGEYLVTTKGDDRGDKKGDEKDNEKLFSVPGGKVFLVEGTKTLQVRCDGKLSRLLREQYETVMESRYFGRGGIEIVPSGQLSSEEIDDLVRLSYNLTKDLKDVED